MSNREERLTVYFNPEHVFINLPSHSKEKAISILASPFYDKGHVYDSFSRAVLDREKVYPTGLQTKTIGIAIPHAEAEHVVSDCLSVGVLKQPILFQKMDDQQPVEVSLIFLLAIAEAKTQLTLLQQITNMIQDEDLLQQIESNSSTEQVYEWITDKLKGITCI